MVAQSANLGNRHSLHEEFSLQSKPKSLEGRLGEMMRQNSIEIRNRRPTSQFGCSRLVPMVLLTYGQPHRHRSGVDDYASEPADENASFDPSTLRSPVLFERDLKSERLPDRKRFGMQFDVQPVPDTRSHTPQGQSMSLDSTSTAPTNSFRVLT